jgi:hypothetical protein
MTEEELKKLDLVVKEAYHSIWAGAARDYGSWSKTMSRTLERWQHICMELGIKMYDERFELPVTVRDPAGGRLMMTRETAKKVLVLGMPS